MAKRFLLAFALILLYMGLYGALILLVITFAGDDPVIIIPLAIGAFILFFPVFYIIQNTVFFFKGEGTPIPLEELKKQILSINDFDVPVMVEERKDRLVITWKYVDAKWWEILAKAGLKSVYSLHVKFKPKKNEVKLIDISKKVQWRASPKEVKFGWSGFRGIMFQVEFGKAWGIKENFQLGKIYDYKFNPSEIKNPVMNTILRSGWNVRFGTW